MTPEADIYMLDTRQVDHYWPKISELLDAEPELWNASWTKGGIYDAIMDERVQAWAICSPAGGPITTMFFTQVLPFETGRTLHIWWMKGHGAIKTFQCASLVVERFAIHFQCKDMLVTGRPGLKKALAAFGGTLESITLRKQIPQQIARH